MHFPSHKRVQGLSLSAAKWTLSVLLASVIGQFAIALAEERGYYAHPTATLNTILQFLTGSWIAHWAGGLIFGFAAGTWVDASLRRKEQEPLIAQTTMDLTGLADEAEKIARGINKLMSENLPRSLSHPDFDKDPDAFRRSNHERDERARREFLATYAADASRIIATARKYVEITDSELFWTTTGGAYSVGETANIMAAIAARVREFQASSAPSSAKGQQPPQSSKRDQ